MYRQHENPHKLEARLAELQKEFEQRPDDIDLYDTIEDLKQRINFAWQDDEYDA